MSKHTNYKLGVQSEYSVCVCVCVSIINETMCTKLESYACKRSKNKISDSRELISLLVCISLHTTRNIGEREVIELSSQSQLAHHSLFMFF